MEDGGTEEEENKKKTKKTGGRDGDLITGGPDVAVFGVLCFDCGRYAIYAIHIRIFRRCFFLSRFATVGKRHQPRLSGAAFAPLSSYLIAVVYYQR